MPGGRERPSATPDLQSSTLSCPRKDPPGATAAGLLKPERFPGIGVVTGSRGHLEALIPVPPPLNKAQNRSSVQSDDSESNTRGSPTAGRGHAIRIPPSYPDALIRRIGRRPSTARCRTDLGRQWDLAEEGAWPLCGGPPPPPVSHRAWATDLHLARIREGSGQGTRQG